MTDSVGMLEIQGYILPSTLEEWSYVYRTLQFHGEIFSQRSLEDI